MSHVIHEVIIVTCYAEELAKRAHVKAKELMEPPNKTHPDRLVTDIVASNINSYYTFFIAPDGSKEGWEEAEYFATQREKFLSWLVLQEEEEGVWYEWMEVKYGKRESGVDVRQIRG